MDDGGGDEGKEVELEKKCGGTADLSGGSGGGLRRRRRQRRRRLGTVSRAGNT